MPHIRLAVVVGLALAIRFAGGCAFAAEPQPARAAVAAPSPGIPQYDLSARRDLQTVVDREAGQYLGHPTTVLLEDGRTMLIVYPKGHGRGPIVMKRSTDGGRTWSGRLPTPASWSTSLEVPTLYRTVDKAGTKRLILFSGLYPIRRAVSADDGRTWSELEPIGAYGGIVACASCVRLNDGDYLALFHDDGRFLTKAGRPKGAAPKFVVYQIRSSDGGLTWSRPEPIAEHATAHLCEPGAIRSPDGKQLCVLLRENSRKLRSFVIFSDDEGRTWTTPRELPASLTGDRHTAAYLGDGRLFVTFRDMLKGGPSAGDWVAWIGAYDDLVAGRAGSFRLRLMDNTKGSDCAYPPVEVLPDGTLFTATYGHWTAGESPYLVGLHLGAKELDAATLATATSSTANVTNPTPINGLAATDGLQWKRLPELNDPRGFGGQFVGTIGDRLVLYGGTNFPDKPIWAGGAKGWYRDLFVLDDPRSAWRKLGPVEGVRAVGYGASISIDRGLLLLGGADAERHYADCLLLSLDGDRPTVRRLPDLPEPCGYLSGARVGDVVYVAGGIAKPDAVETLRTFWALDLMHLEAGWKALEPWPGRGRMLAVAASVDGALYLSSGCDLFPGPDGKPMRIYLRDTYRYDPGRGWSRRADIPAAVVAAPSPAAVSENEKRVFVFGGDDASAFGFKPPEKHPGFPRRTWSYDAAADRWELLGAPAYVPVATVVVPWRGGFVSASGEVRPAVRSREVWWFRAP